MPRRANSLPTSAARHLSFFKKVDRLFWFWHDPSCLGPRAKVQIPGYFLP
jgi:hypothetical protein